MGMPQQLSSFMPVLAWLALSAFLLTVGDLLFRLWAAGGWTLGFWIAFTVYMVGIFCMMLSFFGEHIAIASTICIIFNCVAYLIIAYWFFGDTISPMQLAGIILGIAAVFLMQLGSH